MWLLSLRFREGILSPRQPRGRAGIHRGRSASICSSQGKKQRSSNSSQAAARATPCRCTAVAAAATRSRASHYSCTNSSCAAAAGSHTDAEPEKASQEAQRMQMARLLLRRLRAVAANLAGVAASRTALQVLKSSKSCGIAWTSALASASRSASRGLTSAGPPLPGPRSASTVRSPPCRYPAGNTADGAAGALLVPAAALFVTLPSATLALTWSESAALRCRRLGCPASWTSI